MGSLGNGSQCQLGTRLHPVLELVPLADIWHVCLVVAVGIHLVPVRRRNNLRRTVLGLLEPIFVGRPCDVLSVEHVVGVCVVHGSKGRESVVEVRVGDQSTRIVSCSVCVDRQRLTILSHGILDIRNGGNFSVQLIFTETLGVSSVVGPEVLQPVEKVHMGPNIVRNLELDLANVPLLVKAVPYV
ncbi:hypothetical protein OGAPHI_001661 [Ogataea philodendri]|uniref:Uncharacterized protein n=1 Tax=Ogataea philodendri TaxID=1378263 RepID=A0A9P8T8C5_9ASCO|nr:uncharacterized protein OGAPHI_001661 [Ogataea philodendri]KAH3669065.1 hypothetical protein OGAPHI_001661 [Ogataea philodendri]